MITEPWVNNNNDICGLGPLKIYYVKSNTKKCRAAIAFNNNINFWPMPEFSCEDVACGSVKRNDMEIIICSVYMDINLNEIPSKLQDLCDFCNSNNKKLIICTDSNSHSMLWGAMTSITEVKWWKILYVTRFLKY